MDTNVLSELMRSQPAAAVFAWVAALAAAAEAMFTDDFVGRVLSFEEAAVHYAEIVYARHREGPPIEAFDSQIAATARVAGAELATRDIGGFSGSGLTLVNPWEAA